MSKQKTQAYCQEFNLQSRWSSCSSGIFQWTSLWSKTMIFRYTISEIELIWVMTKSRVGLKPGESESHQNKEINYWEARALGESSSWTLKLHVWRHGEERKTITRVSKFLLRCIGSIIRREGERSFKQGEVFAYSAGVLRWKCLGCWSLLLELG